MSGIVAADMAKKWDRGPFEQLLAAAKANGWRKQDIAERVGVPPSTLSDWIKDKHAPHPIFQQQFDRIRKEFERRPRKR